MSSEPKYNFVWIGLGTMGRNLLLNTGNHRFKSERRTAHNVYREKFSRLFCKNGA